MKKLVYGYENTDDGQKNLRMIEFPMDVNVPAVGTPRFDDFGKRNGYWGSNAAWNGLGTPGYETGELRVDIVDDSDNVIDSYIVH